ncbi:hypothetical protein BDN70DRAFT_454516 [Pholiota conissans]|uniref:Uncharacterized protein n=1 Tax=Pholiota conissans TaxID=109636 RepID=A0A9P5YRE7_9AGAR|nr:hypothetical protein BDN70DRAFT_454516 [Pholiota conissans]
MIISALFSDRSRTARRVVGPWVWLSADRATILSTGALLSTSTQQKMISSHLHPQNRLSTGHLVLRRRLRPRNHYCSCSYIPAHVATLALLADTSHLRSCSRISSAKCRAAYCDAKSGSSHWKR